METQLLLAHELGYLRHADTDRIFALHGEIARMLDALSRKLRAKSKLPA